MTPVVSTQTNPLTSFSKNGFWYEQVIRDGNVAIFKQRLRPGEGELAFEVFTIKVLAASKMFGRDVPAHEAGPSNESFGFTAWSFNTLAKAKAKMAELLERGVSK